ncbi:MAG: DUF1579 family protein [Candidatus Sulfotelmatobacter sp.]
MRNIWMLPSVVLLMAASALAQMEAPKPEPELKKLDMFAGSWTLDGNIKPGPMGPGGKVLEKESCEWMQGGFFVVCKVTFTSTAMGNGSGITLMGYSDKVYSYREFNSWGEFTDSKGTIDGDTWNWTNDQKTGHMPFQGKFTMKILSPASYNFNYAISQDGTQWNTVMEGKATKDK